MNVNKSEMSASPVRLGLSNLCIRREENISLDRKTANAKFSDLVFEKDSSQVHFPWGL